MTGQERFDPYFEYFAIFWIYCYCQSFISGGGAGDWAMSPPYFEILGEGDSQRNYVIS